MARNPIGAKKCYFCGSTEKIERHHIIQKRFRVYFEGMGGNIHLSKYKIWMCHSCHRKYHKVTDILLLVLIPFLKPPPKKTKTWVLQVSLK